MFRKRYVYQIDQTIKVKNCLICKQTKPIKEFHRDKTTKGGYAGRCRDCSSALMKKYYGENSREISLKKKIIRGTPGGRQKELDYSKQYYESNKASIKERVKKNRAGKKTIKVKKVKTI